ncbi:MAG: hypothetical protein MJ032_01475, partial [Acidaminococcaceae bacterium]|nr:hypothetical protein [Acidaminococcaceae bacterium]
VLKNKQGYMLVDNDRLRHAIKENIDPYKLPTRNQMEAVCRKGNVDIAFAMELTNYEYSPLSISTLNSPMIKMNVKAKLISYNRLTGKYSVKDCIDDQELDEVFTSRWDVVQESWSKMVRQEMDRITRVKKK